MKRIILDTSFLVNCVRFKIDFIEEIRRICGFRYGLFIVDKTLDELNSIVDKGGKDASFAKIVLQMIKKFKIALIKTNSEESVDELIMCEAVNGGVVATQDMILRKRLDNIDIPVIFIRQKKYLSF